MEADARFGGGRGLVDVDAGDGGPGGVGVGAADGVVEDEDAVCAVYIVEEDFLDLGVVV